MAYTSNTIELVQPTLGLKSFVTHHVAETQNSEGLTLVFAHSASNHKEQWEIIVSQLFSLCPGTVNEAWAVEWQNHGLSAIANSSALANRILTFNDYAEALRQLIESPDLAGKRLVLVGHSAGTCAWIIALFQCILPNISIVSIILFEPAYILPPIEVNDERMVRGELNNRGVMRRKATFSSRDEAAQWAQKRMPWKTWDKRMFECYMEYGFRLVSPNSEQVVLNCTLEQELQAYSPYVPALGGHLYSRMCTMYPVHGIFGERPDMYSKKIRERFYDGKDGHIMASVQIIPKAGHMLVQECPDIAAQMIASILTGKVTSMGSVESKSHL